MSKDTKESLMAWVKDIAIAVIVAVIILQVIRPTIVKEYSMMDTLHENDYLIVSKQAYLFKEPQRGDIIVFDSDLELQNGGHKRLIKRVIGVPGDTVEVKEGDVYLNGGLLDEKYILEQFTSGIVGPLLIPEGKLFVMGDNRQNSADSRDERIGLISYDQVYGEAVIRLFPFDEIGLL